MAKRKKPPVTKVSTTGGGTITFNCNEPADKLRGLSAVKKYLDDLEQLILNMPDDEFREIVLARRERLFLRGGDWSEAEMIEN